MNKEHRYLPAVIALLAGLVISILVIVNRVETLRALILVFSFLLGFYILGSIFRAILNKFETKPEPEEVITEEASEEDTDDVEDIDSSTDDDIEE